MAIPLPIIVAAAELAAKLYMDEQRRRDEKEKDAKALAGFARLLSANNDFLVKEISGSVKALLNQAKLDDCTNKLSTLSVFFEEYGNNTLDQGKLSLVEQQCQFILDILDDQELELAGIRTYMAVTSLRISSLLLKANFQPGDLQNARDLAARAVSHTTWVAARMRSIPPGRIFKFLFCMPGINVSIPGTSGGSSNPFCHCSITVSLDGREVYKKRADFMNPQDSEKMYKKAHEELDSGAAAFIEGKIATMLSELPLDEIDRCLAEWRILI